MSPFDQQMLDTNAACLSTFGRPITYKPAAGGSFAIKAIEVNPATLEIATSPQHAIYWIRAVDLPAAPVRGDVVTINAIDYNVHDAKDDKGGGFNIFLDKN